MNIKVKNELGNAKEIKLGFSWTFFFFGFFVPLFRKDWKYFLIILVASTVLSVLGLGLVAWIGNVVLSFIYNKLYAKDLYEEGYRGLTEEENKLLVNYISN